MTRNPRPTAPAPHVEDDVPSQRLDESIGFLLNETARLSRRLLYQRLARRGIRGGSWYLLRVLWEGDGVTQRELAERLGMTQPSTLEMLRAMERDDLIRFERDPHDKRKTRVYLTTRAWSLKAPLLHMADEATEVMAQRLSPAEGVALRMLLRVIRDTMAETIGNDPLDAALDERAAIAAAAPARKRAAPAPASRTAAKPPPPAAARARKPAPRAPAARK